MERHVPADLTDPSAYPRPEAFFVDLRWAGPMNSGGIPHSASIGRRSSPSRTSIQIVLRMRFTVCALAPHGIEAGTSRIRLVLSTFASSVASAASRAR